MRRSRRFGGLDNTWVQGRRAARFFLNDNLAWSVGAHELRFGTNTRIFRLNDYDFGEGAVPMVTYTDLPQFIYGVASTATEDLPAGRFAAVQFPESGSLCAGHLEADADTDLDLRPARDTQFKSAESARCGGAPAGFVRCDFARCRISRSSSSIQTNLGNVFRSRRRWRSCSRRTAHRVAIGASKTVLRTGFGLFSDLLPGSVVDLVGDQSALSRIHSRAAAGNGRRNRDRARSSEQRRRCDRRGESDVPIGLSRRGRFPARRPDANPDACLQPVAITAVPDGKLHAPYFMQWSFGVGAADRHHDESARAICRHARREPAVHDAGQRIPDGVPGLFCAVSLWPAPRSAIRRRDAAQHRREQPLQRAADDGREAARPRIAGSGELHLEPLHRHGLERRIPAVLGRAEFFRRFPAISTGTAAHATTTSATTSPRNYVYQLARQDAKSDARRMRSMAGRYPARHSGTAACRSRF